jgi:hypothetical protein
VAALRPFASKLAPTGGDRSRLVGFGTALRSFAGKPRSYLIVAADDGGFVDVIAGEPAPTVGRVVLSIPV